MFSEPPFAACYFLTGIPISSSCFPTQDALAKAIIDRVNNSPYGHKGRKRGATTTSRSRPAASESKDGESPVSQSTQCVGLATETLICRTYLMFCSPSSEWQDALTAQLNARAAQRNTLIEDGESFGETDNKDLPQTLTYPPSPSDDGASQQDRRPSLAVPSTESRPTTAGAGAESTLSVNADGSGSEQHRRQRRRVETESGARSPSTTSVSGRSQSPAQYACLPPHPALLPKRSPTSLSNRRHSTSPDAPEAEADESSDEEYSGSGEDELAVAVGQLSMNEEEQVRYHGKASGLHLLGGGERQDGRNEGGIWYVIGIEIYPTMLTSS